MTAAGVANLQPSIPFSACQKLHFFTNSSPLWLPLQSKRDQKIPKINLSVTFCQCQTSKGFERFGSFKIIRLLLPGQLMRNPRHYYESNNDFNF